MQFDIISIFPEVIYSYGNSSLFKRAQEKKIFTLRVINPRDFTKDKHNSVDAPPYGGGPGMVMKVEPIWEAVKKAKKKKIKKRRIILFSIRGKKFSSKDAKRFAHYDQLIMICGRYEGIDERVAKYLADEEISIGDYILAGGEIPALAVTEAVSRHLKGFLGKENSLEEKKGSYPVYTRPPILKVNLNGKKKKIKVPEILLRGNHQEINLWRKNNGKLIL